MVGVSSIPMCKLLHLETLKGICHISDYFSNLTISCCSLHTSSSLLKGLFATKIKIMVVASTGLAGPDNTASISD